MTRCAIPGSFDPVTNGHLDVVRRSAVLFDEVVVLVTHNPQKRGTFSVDERVRFIESAVEGCDSIRVDTWSGLLADYARDNDVDVLVKGVRSVADYEYELAMAHANRGLCGVDTLLMPAAPQYAHVSSTMYKEVTSLGGDMAEFVPPAVDEAMKARAKRR